MKCSTRKMRSPLKWHGGKSYVARRIVALMPEHHTYVEPFAGGLSVLLNKPKAEREVASDLNLELIRFWRTLRHRPSWITEELITLDYNESVFKCGRKWLRSESDLLRAVGFLIRNRFSRGGLGKDFAWSERLRGGKPGDANAWDTIRAEIPAIAERIRDIEFNLAPAWAVIDLTDGPNTLFYLDPPYLHETRTTRSAYAHEMTAADHATLLQRILGVEGTVMISGYRSELYDTFLKDWHRVEFEIANHSGQGKSKQRRIECVWSNRLFANKGGLG